MTAKTIADKVNVTLLAKSSAPKRSTNEFPLINPGIQAFETASTSLAKFWKKYRYSSDGTESVQLSRLLSPGFNFGYCDNYNLKFRDSWNFLILLKAYDIYVWITVTTTLISNGTSFWGTVTSLLIRPPEDDVMKDISETVSRNYSLIFNSFIIQGIVSATAKSYSRKEKGHGTWEDMKNIRILLQRMRKGSTQKSFEEMFIYAGKTVSLYLWPFVLAYVNRANLIIAKKQPIPSKRRRCYVGKRLIPSGEIHYGFSPPGSERLRQVFQSMYETHLYSYWMSEGWKMTFAERVQDRAKVRSPTHIEQNLGSAVRPLQLEGTILSVFFLWGICLVASGLSYGSEIYLCWRNKACLVEEGIDVFKTGNIKNPFRCRKSLERNIPSGVCKQKGNRHALLNKYWLHSK
ncbi:unnamed protein product [Orchesella dallaii]|uniref:Uncharacterized protein n=1 Tax=Orchesella dallaii TaxID=48710 RepID=A0ABP1Q3K2_9HEXA